MEFIDSMDAEALERTEFPTLVVVQQVIAKSAARVEFALHLSTSSKQPDMRFHCYKSGKPAKVRAADLCSCFYRLIRRPDCRFGRCPRMVVRSMVEMPF
jgi:hypothetical protein